MGASASSPSADSPPPRPDVRGETIFHTFDFASAEASDLPDDALRALAIGLAKGVDLEALLRDEASLKQVNAVINSSKLAQETFCRAALLLDGSVPPLPSLLEQIRRPFACLGLLAPKYLQDQESFDLFYSACLGWTRAGEREVALELMQRALAVQRKPCAFLREHVTQHWFSLLFSQEPEQEADATSMRSLVLNLFTTAVLVDALSPSEVWALLVRGEKTEDSLAYSLMFLVCSAAASNNLAAISDERFARFVWQGLLRAQEDKFAFGLLQLAAPQAEEDLAFRTLLSLFQLLSEDTGVHLISEPINLHLDTLLVFPSAAAAGGVSWTYSIEWTCALFAKGLRNANGEVVKFVLWQILSRCASGNGKCALPSWFVAQHLLPRLQIEELYSPSMYEMTGAFKVQATAVATGRTASKKKYAEAQHVTLFNLPDALHGFFCAQARQGDQLLAYLACVVEYKSLSAACVCVEALCRAIFSSVTPQAGGDNGIPDEYFADLLKVISFHGTHAGMSMKRGNMITGCLLNLVVFLGTFLQVFTTCKQTPDYFLQMDSPIKMVTNPAVNFLGLLGASPFCSSNNAGVTSTLSPSDFALVFAARFAAGNNASLHIRFTTERDLFDFAYRVLQLAPARCFPPSFFQALQELCLHRIKLELEQVDALTLLEDAWSEGGYSKAKPSTKLDSLAYAALQISMECEFSRSEQDLFALAKREFLDETRTALQRLRALVVCSVFFLPSAEEEDELVRALCALKERQDFIFSLSSSSHGLHHHQTNESMLWCELEERKWLILSKSCHTARIHACAQAQVEQWESNSNTVNCYALDCFLRGKPERQAFDELVSRVDLYRICTPDMQTVLVKNTANWLADGQTLRTLLTQKHLAVGLVKRLALHLFTKLWKSNAQAAIGFENEIVLMLNHTDRVWELQDFSAHEASRSVKVLPVTDEQLFICRSTKTIHPASFVAFCALHWIGEQDEEFARSFALLLVRELFAQTQFQTKILSIALLLCSKHKLDASVVSDVLALLARGGLPPETKENLEMTLVRLIWRDKAAMLRELAQTLAAPKSQNNGYLVMSLLSVASIAWRVRNKEEEAGEVVDEILLDLALPWLGCAKSSIRILATNICFAVSQRKPVSRELELILAPMECNGQMQRLMQRVTEDQESNAKLYFDLDLATLLETREFNLFGDLCPLDLKVDKIAEFVRMGQDEFFAEFEQEQQPQGEEEQAAPVPAQLRFQRKIVRPLALLDDQATTTALTRARKRNLVVVATLVDKIPNLAGLARTCEVFSARTLVMEKDPAEIISLPEFKSISRTAENWLPMISVKRDALREYLLQLRTQHGYMIVGLEQTSDSIMLQDFAPHWPAHGNVCIVLGAEGTGIPPQVLACLDRTIEIPQIGHIKSLNVHVSGAMCVWAYTEAMMRWEKEQTTGF